MYTVSPTYLLFIYHCSYWNIFRGTKVDISRCFTSSSWDCKSPGSLRIRRSPLSSAKQRRQCCISHIISVTINTLYTLMRRNPYVFLSYCTMTLLYLCLTDMDTIIPLFLPPPVLTPVWPLLLFYLHTIPCSLVPDTSHPYSLIWYALSPRMYINPCT